MERDFDSGLYLYYLLLKYPPLGEGRELRYVSDDGEVKVIHPLKDVGEWKIFVACMLIGKEVQSTDEEVVLEVRVEELARLTGNYKKSVKFFVDKLAFVRFLGYMVSRKKEKEREYFSVGFMKDLCAREVFYGKRAYLRLSLNREFYELCKQKGVLLYSSFLFRLKSRTSMALLLFLTTHANKRFNRTRLWERSGLSRTLETRIADYYLGKALDQLLSVGFLKAWQRKGDVYYVERHDQETLRQNALRLIGDFVGTGNLPAQSL